MKNEQAAREPILLDIYRECSRTYGSTCSDEFNAGVLRAILLRYTPATLHRIAASGSTYCIRGAGIDALERVSRTT